MDATERPLEAHPGAIQKNDLSAPNIAAAGSFLVPDAPSGTNNAVVSQRIGADAARVMPLSEAEVSNQLAQVDLSHTQRTEQLQVSQIEERKVIEALASPVMSNAGNAGQARNAFSSFNAAESLPQSPI